MTARNGHQQGGGGRPAVFCIGVSHHTAPVELRERLAALPPEWLKGLEAGAPTLQEWAVVATCNRWELYGAGPAPAHVMVEALAPALQAALGSDAKMLPAHLYVYTDKDAARHLCRVAAGLDSLILGESQILGQVTGAYTAGVEAGTVGPALSTLFRAAMRGGKRARAETAISAKAASMSAVAVAMAEQQIGALQGRRVLVIGAGEIAQLAVKALHARQAAAVTVANRTRAKAEAILLDHRWRAIGLDGLAAALDEADVVFCATRAAEFIITAEMLARRKPQEPRQARPLVLIDLAVPRNVEPGVAHLPGISLCDVDDLRVQLDQGLAARRGAVPLVEAILEEELASWELEMRELGLRPLVVALRQKAEQIRQAEVERTLRFLGDVDEATRNHIQHLSRALVNKLLHEPTVQIKALAQDEDAAAQVAAIRQLFGLDAGVDASTVGSSAVDSSVEAAWVEQPALNGRPSSSVPTPHDGRSP
ncbi:MAG TPA: glutamyl-tRNA reductase [Caldilineaceae bacterium]|nr:glutamyl-tRNA reductase [Caldilineaceae bacterium]